MKIDSSLIQICIKLYSIINSTSRISPIFSMFCFTGKTIEAFNGIQGMKADFETDFTGCVNAKEFINVLTAYNDIDIKKKDDTFILKSGKSKVTLKVSPIEEFIQFGIGKKKKLLFQVTPIFIEGLKKCKISVPKNDLRPQQYGIAVVTNILYSTDNARISKYETDIDNKSMVLFPLPFCDQLIKLYNGTPVDVFMEKDVIEVDFDNIKLYTKIDTELVLLDYEAVLQRNDNDNISIPIPESFKETVIKLKSISVGVTKIHLDIAKDIIELSTTSSTCDIKEIVDIENLTYPLSCDYDIEKFTNSLKVIDVFKFVENDNSIIMYGKSGAFTHILTSLIR